MKVTESDLLDAIRAALVKPTVDGAGKTVRDLAASTGYADQRVRRSLQILADEGRLEVGRTPWTSIDGRVMMVPSYSIKPNGKK